MEFHLTAAGLEGRDQCLGYGQILHCHCPRLQSGKGEASRLPPSRTTGHGGPHPAVRRVKLLPAS